MNINPVKTYKVVKIIFPDKFTLRDYFGQTAPPFQCKRRHLKESEFVTQ